MSRLIVLRRVKVENANAVSGLTWGFPGMTHFLGFTHALSRKLQHSHHLRLDGCGVISHGQQVQAYHTGRDYKFAITRNPLTKEGKTAPFNEEGRMHMTVSLLMECHGDIEYGELGINALTAHLAALCPTLRLAGGTIVDIESIEVCNRPENVSETRKILRRMMPGFALLDRSSLLAQHFTALKANNPHATLLDAWLDFLCIKTHAVREISGEQDVASAPVRWRRRDNVAPGYLVPLMTGYRGISECYPPGQVDKARDPTLPFCFTEAIHSIGEWQGVFRIQAIDELIWRYRYAPGLYRCQSAQQDDVEDFTSHAVDYD